MRLQRTCGPSLRSGCSRCSLGSPLTRYPLGRRNPVILLVLLGAAAACGLPAHPSRQDLVGSWSVKNEFGHETLDLRADGTFSQELVDSSGHSRRNDGRWDLRPGSRESILHLQSAISLLDQADRQTTDVASLRPSDVDLHAMREWGRLTLEFDPDLEGFTKRE